MERLKELIIQLKEQFDRKAEPAHMLETTRLLESDTLAALVAAFLLIWQCVVVANPNAYIIGAGVALLGAPAARKLDSLRKRVAPDDE